MKIKQLQVTESNDEFESIEWKSSDQRNPVPFTIEQHKKDIKNLEDEIKKLQRFDRLKVSEKAGPFEDNSPEIKYIKSGKFLRQIADLSDTWMRNSWSFYETDNEVYMIHTRLATGGATYMVYK